MFRPPVHPPNESRFQQVPRLHLLEKYDLTDDFADTPDYELFYTELTGTVQILLEDGIQ